MAFAVLVLGFTGCAGKIRHGEIDAPYIVPAEIDMTELLPPPPADPLLQERDIAAVRAAQAARTPAETERVEVSASVGVFQFADVLGPEFTAGRLPVTAHFFAKVNQQVGPFLFATKECWRRPRPFIVDETIRPPARSLASTVARTGGPPPPLALRPNSPCVGGPRADKGYTFSYPSGHAAVGTLEAILLAEVLPERRDQIFARGWELGDARVVGGVHFPTDVEAGRIMATTLVAFMMRNERFNADLTAVRAELRAGLGFRD